jgi:hypothetical protein
VPTTMIIQKQTFQQNNQNSASDIYLVVQCRSSYCIFWWTEDTSQTTSKGCVFETGGIFELSKNWHTWLHRNHG